MKRTLPTTNAGVKRKSLFSLIACWFSKEEPVCGGGPEKAAKDASESKDGKVCSNGEIRLKNNRTERKGIAKHRRTPFRSLSGDHD